MIGWGRAPAEGARSNLGEVGRQRDLVQGRVAVAGHLLVSYGFGPSLRSARTVLENTILTAVPTVE